MPNGFTRSLSKRFSRRKRRNERESIGSDGAVSSSVAATAGTNGDVPTNSSSPPGGNSALANLASPPPHKGLVGRSMDRLRRSIRQTLRKRGDRDAPPELVPGGSGAGNSRNEAWQPDEGAVRAGLCHFNVKVFESRGMQVCEGALKLLRVQSKTRRPVKAILYVSGDGLRVVDQENNRGLIVDQTIEKVSFCAPDRNNDKGFAYICRDGTSRRWMCHGFHATKETGERLSHAVGCAFAVCLERKKKRDEETAAANAQQTPSTAAIVEKALNPNWDMPNGEAAPSLERTNHAYQSFRRLSINERKIDPQSAVLATPITVPPPLSSSPSVPNGRPLGTIAKPRPQANPALFERQGSLRAPESSGAAAFRRQFSLRNQGAASLDSGKMFYSATPSTLFNEPIYEGEETAVPASEPVTAHDNWAGAAQWGEQQWESQRAPIVSSQSNSVLPDSAISVNTNWSSPSIPSFASMGGPVSARSKADEWLDDVLRSSLSLSSPPPPVIDLQASPRAPPSGPPPSQPPPPLPPTAILNSPSRPVFVSENVPPAVSQSNGVDVFGQPVFGVPSQPPSMPKAEDDPFDVRWSKLALNGRHNPFSQESAQVNI